VNRLVRLALSVVAFGLAAGAVGLVESLFVPDPYPIAVALAAACAVVVGTTVLERRAPVAV